MFLIVGTLIGVNLAVRIVLGEARELRGAGRVSTRGASRMRLSEIAGIALRGGVFLLAPMAIGLALDVWFGTEFYVLFG